MNKPQNEINRLYRRVHTLEKTVAQMQELLEELHIDYSTRNPDYVVENWHEEIDDI